MPTNVLVKVPLMPQTVKNLPSNIVVFYFIVIHFVYFHHKIVTKQHLAVTL